MKNFLFFFSHSGTTFKNTVSESSPQDGSTRGLNLVLIVVALLAIFILAIAVVFGISFFGRHQGHKNQGKFLASFPYLLIAFVCLFFFLSTSTRLVLPLNGIFSWRNASSLHSFIIFTPLQNSVFKNGIIECATLSHFSGSFGFLQMLFLLYLDSLCLRWILRPAFYGAFGFFEDRKCRGVPKVIDNQPSFFNTSSFLLNFSEYGKNLNKFTYHWHILQNLTENMVKISRGEQNTLLSIEKLNPVPSLLYFGRGGCVNCRSEGCLFLIFACYKHVGNSFLFWLFFLFLHGNDVIGVF